MVTLTGSKGGDVLHVFVCTKSVLVPSNTKSPYAREPPNYRNEPISGEDWYWTTKHPYFEGKSQVFCITDYEFFKDWRPGEPPPITVWDRLTGDEDVV
jgi:hypothetical protein